MKVNRLSLSLPSTAPLSHQSYKPRLRLVITIFLGLVRRLSGFPNSLPASHFRAAAARKNPKYSRFDDSDPFGGCMRKC